MKDTFLWFLLLAVLAAASVAPSEEDQTCDPKKPKDALEQCR